MSGCSCEEYETGECDYCQGFKDGKKRVYDLFNNFVIKIMDIENGS